MGKKHGPFDPPPTVRAVMLTAGVDGVWYPALETEDAFPPFIQGLVILHKRGDYSRLAARRACIELAAQMGVPFKE